MAWLETKGDVFRIRFRYGKAKHLLALDKKEADEALARFKGNLRLIERGIIDPLDEAADVGVYIVSGGNLSGRPSEATRTQRATLGMLFDSCLTNFLRAAKEASTWKTETQHIGHLRRSPAADDGCCKRSVVRGVFVVVWSPTFVRCLPG